MRVLSMTPEQINSLPPTERTTYIQIVSFFIHYPLLSCRVHGSLVDDFPWFFREPLLVFRHDARQFFFRWQQ